MGCAASSAAIHAGGTEQEYTQDQLKEIFARSIKANNGRLIVSGLLHRANHVNSNRRMYPKAVLRREVKRYQRIHMANGMALGELDHPSYTSSTFRSLNLGNVSHQVLDIFWAGNNLMGTIEILPTPSGKILMELYRSGRNVGVSSRGWASLKEEDGCITIQNDFELITFDFVTEPSTQGAFLIPTGKYRGKLPTQTMAVRLAYLAAARKHEASNSGDEPQCTVLAMDRALKKCIHSLYEQAGHILPTIEDQWVPSAGDSQTQPPLKIPPHPTKIRPRGDKAPPAQGPSAPNIAAGAGRAVAVGDSTSLSAPMPRLLAA